MFCSLLVQQEYSKLLIHAPEVLEDMELVDQPNDAESKCSCSRLTKKVLNIILYSDNVLFTTITAQNALGQAT